MFLKQFWNELKHSPSPNNEYYLKLMSISQMNIDIVKNIERNNKIQKKLYR